ncbi:MAG: hypothetical protein KAT58_08770 [candidate division Zixibacteria bacterium]|nr:hypothetical protein [candidate division Zixibacteria bacterium]
MEDTTATKTNPQPEITAQLGSLLANSRLHSSLLFAGRKGVGKWTVAQELAKAITCRENQQEYCGKCHSCRQADRFIHPDIYYLFPLPKEKEKEDKPSRYLSYLQHKADYPFADGSDDVTSFITIDSIRKFQTRLAHKASLSSRKVGIIYEAERMLPAAMDSLLKTLEEPPPNSYLFVITDQPRFLPETIQSRLLRVNFPLLTDEFIAAYLREHFPVAEEKITILTHLAGGSLYNIEFLVEGDYLRARETAFGLFENALRLAPADFQVKYADSATIATRDKVERLLRFWQSFLRDMAYLSSLPEGTPDDTASGLINFDLRERYGGCLQKITSFDKLYHCNECIEQVRQQLRRNVTPRMAAFSFLLDLAGHNL